MDRDREAEIALHIALGRRLDPPLRPDEEAVAHRLRSEIAARVDRDARRHRPPAGLIPEWIIFTGIHFWGTWTWPLAAAEVSLSTALLTAVAATVICQLAMGVNGLYRSGAPVDRAELPNRLLASLGCAIIFISILIFAFPPLWSIAVSQWQLMLLLTLSFGAIWAWRAGVRGPQERSPGNQGFAHI